MIGDAAAEAKIPIANSYMAANIFTFLPTMISLRRWALEREISREDMLSDIAEFLVRGLGFGTRD